MIKRLSKIFEYAFVMVIICLFNNYSKKVTEGISLWAACVLPSLFPYLFLTTLLSAIPLTSKLFYKLSPITRPLFKVGGNSTYAFFLSLISGYPIGAKTVSELRLSNLIDEDEGVRAACLCSTSSPTFLISSVGAITFSNKAFGILLYLSHFFGVVLNGFVFSFYKSKNFRPKKTLPVNKDKKQNLLYEASFSSVISVLVVGGLITIFFLLTSVLIDLKILVPLEKLLTYLLGEQTLAKGIIYGLFECTVGMKTLSSLPLKIALPACAFLSGFGGLSVIAQSLAYLKNAKIKTAPFILSKITCAVFSLSFSFIFSLLL